eukprot:scaffold3548_cov79-Skeletonema_dohrnii-CCMP3373.AAC.4
MEGLFCANYGVSRNGFPACQSAWHPGCYTCLGKGKFPMMDLRDEAGNIWHTQENRVKRLDEAVKGAHLVIPFQCETCWIRLLEKREMKTGDEVYQMCIRRANLDAIAGRTKNTISAHVNRMASVIRNCEVLNKTPSYPSRGPFPDFDCVGMGVAVEMVHKTTVARGSTSEYIQYSTARQVRSTFSVSYLSSVEGVVEGGSFARGTGRVRPTRCPTESPWFIDFLRGCEYRMGHESRANKPISMRATVEILLVLRSKAEDKELVSAAMSNHYYKVGAMLAISTACSLRGTEAFYLSLAGLISNLKKGQSGTIPEGYSITTIFTEEQAMTLPHVVICLLGHFKGETGSDYHMMNVANVTTSGLKVRWWVEKLVEVCKNEGRKTGPAFADARGRLGSSLDYDATFREAAREVQEVTDFISDDLDVNVFLSLSRTPRKSAESRSKQAGVATSIQDAVNRWRSVENAKGRKPRFKDTRDTYATAVAEMPNTWRYSYAL